MLPLRRRWLGFIAVLFLMVIASYYCGSYLTGELFPHEMDETRQEKTVQINDVVFPQDSTTNHTLCEPHECTRGSWFPRQPPFRSIADFRRKYPKTHFGAFKICGSEENTRDEEDRRIFHQAQEERLVQTMNWIWRPVKGQMPDFNAVEFVIRLLRSPGGLVFAGDSITRQHVHWFSYALSRADIHVVQNPSYLPVHSEKHLHQYVLKPGDYMSKYLQDRAGVPESRLRRPIYTYIENFILIGEKEVREFTVPLGADENFRWRDIFAYFEGWEDYVRDVSVPKDEKNVIEDSILVLNTGAHWSRGPFFMLPNKGSAAEQQSRVAETYKKMIRLIESRLDSIPHLSIFYRPTSPAHPACTSSTFYQSFRVNSTVVAPAYDNNADYKPFTENSEFYTLPYSNFTMAQATMSPDSIQQAVSAASSDLNVRTVRLRWDWDRFESHNAEWKRMIDNKSEKQSSETSGMGARWYYMDTWEMALQRPDAHTQNLVDPAHENYDCLHWCVPGVVEQWLQLLYHTIMWEKAGKSSSHGV